MAHHKSALKRIRQSRKNRLYNRANKKAAKEAIKAVRSSVSFDDAMIKLKSMTSILDKVGAHGVIHKNNIAHTKSRMAQYVNSLTKD